MVWQLAESWKSVDRRRQGSDVVRRRARAEEAELQRREPSRQLPDALRKDGHAPPELVPRQAQGQRSQRL